MKTFKIKLPDYTETEVEVENKFTVKQLIQHIKDQQNEKKWAAFELELYLFDQVLKEDGQVDKIILNYSTDYLWLKVKKGEQKKKLKQFFQEAIIKIQKKTEDQFQGFQKNLHKSHTLKEQPQKTEKQNIKKLLSFFQQASFKVAESFRNKAQNFQNNLIQRVSNKTASQDPSRIHIEEDPQKNNDTVIGLLDDLHQIAKKDNKQRSVDSQIKPKSLSPEVRKYLERKKKAIENLNDPNSQEKAKKLVTELRRQRRELEERKYKQKLDESEKLEESIEKYKFEREQEKEYVNNEKRERIKERLAEMQKQQEIKSQMNEHQKQLIQALKSKEKEKKRQLEEKEDMLKKQYYEDAKLKLQQRKKLAVPIRLEEINKHEEDYLNKKQLLKLEKDQKKLEREITIQQETKQNYRSLQFLSKVMENDQKAKNKEILLKQQNAEKLMRKQKYAEIVKEYHKPALKIQTDIQFAKGVHNKSDNSIQEEYVEFLKEGESKSNPYKFDSIRNKLQKQTSQGQEKNVHKIQNVLHQQKVQKTKITESLQKGYMPNPSVYYQPKQMKTDIQVQETENKKKPIDYLKELERQRQEQEKQQQQSLSVPRLNQNQNSIIEISKRYEKIAQRKEHQAFYLKDDRLKEEADELLFKSVQQKIKFLEKQ